MALLKRFRISKNTPEFSPARLTAQSLYLKVSKQVNSATRSVCPSATYSTAWTCWSRRVHTACTPTGSRNCRARNRRRHYCFRSRGRRPGGRWGRLADRRRRARPGRSVPTFPCASSRRRDSSGRVWSSSASSRQYPTRRRPESPSSR